MLAINEMKLNGKEINQWEADRINFVIDSLPEYATPQQVAKDCAYDFTWDGISDDKLHKLIGEAIKANPDDPRVEHQVGKVETYDVCFGMCYNTKARPASHVYNELYDYLEEAGLLPDEYFSGYHTIENADPAFPDYWQLAVFAVPGGSEGWYIHVAALLKDGTVETVFLGKTLREGRQACRYAYRIAEEINWWFNN